MNYETLVFMVYVAVSLLADRGIRRVLVSLRRNEGDKRTSRFSAIKKLTATAALLCLAGMAQAFQSYNVIVTADPASEATLLADATSQFNASVIPDQFFPNTYNITLLGLNPAYNPQPSSLDLLNAIVTVDSYTYVQGWANGGSYNQFQMIGLLQNTTDSFLIGCSTGSANLSDWFTLTQTTSKTFDPATCQDVVNSIADAIYNMNQSTVAVVPGAFQ